MSWTSPTVLAAARFTARMLLVVVALAAGAELFVGGCGKEAPTGATVPVSKRSAADSSSPPAEGAPGYATAEVGLTWTMHGVVVTIVGDDWGEGTCHALDVGRHCRTFRIENGSSTSVYSRLAIFNGPAPGCGTYGPGGATRDPHMFVGADVVAPGATETVAYCVDVTRDKCNRIQVSDSWGPLGVFVVGDVFDFSRRCPLAATLFPTLPPGPTATVGPTLVPTSVVTFVPTLAPTLAPTVVPTTTVTPTPTP